VTSQLGRDQLPDDWFTVEYLAVAKGTGMPGGCQGNSPYSLESYVGLSRSIDINEFFIQ